MCKNAPYAKKLQIIKNENVAAMITILKFRNTDGTWTSQTAGFWALGEQKTHW